MYVILFVEFFSPGYFLRPIQIERAVIFEHLLYKWNALDVELVVLAVSVEEMWYESADRRELFFI